MLKAQLGHMTLFVRQSTQSAEQESVSLVTLFERVP